ncbi:MAG: FAD-dependent oxidoreductase [Sphingobacteriales bacterium]|nr:MAG: FAD-dependent oxidoreductase [Sphingobacteriales bacterium]
MKKVTVIGGGVIGMCSAYYLKKAGYDVRVIERGDIRQGTSFGNAGYISPSHFIPLATPGIVAKGLQWMLSSSSPFYIKPRLNMDLIRWGLQFYKMATAKKVEENAVPLNDILQLSRELTSDIKNDLGNQFRMEEIGCFMLYKNPSTEKHEIELAKEAMKFKIDTKILSAAEVQALEPEVKVDCIGGVLYPIDAHLHPGEFMQALHKFMDEQGVELMLNTTVTGFEKQGDKVKRVHTDKGDVDVEELVIATGSWLPIITESLGIHMLLQAGKGYSMTFEDMKNNLRYPAILVDNRVAMTPFKRDLRMGGTMEISGLQSPTLIKRAQAIFKAAKLYYPELDVEFPGIDKVWSGLRPLSPDGLPYIGRHSRYNNLTIAGGHAMLGLSLAAGTGKLVEEIVGHKNTSIKMDAFNVERF